MTNLFTDEQLAEFEEEKKGWLDPNTNNPVYTSWETISLLPYRREVIDGILLRHLIERVKRLESKVTGD